MTYDLYRGDHLVDTVEIPGERLMYVQYRHPRRFFVDPPLDINEMVDAIEVFRAEPDGRYQSQNAAQLPAWVIQQELKQAMDRDRNERWERIKQVMKAAGWPMGDKL